MRRKRVTLADLAVRLGLSVQTVSKGLTGKPGMSEETRSEIFKLAKEMGYLTRDQKSTLAYERISPFPLLKRRFVLLHNEQSMNFNRLLLAGLHDRFTEFGHAVDPILTPPHLGAQSFRDWVEESGLAYAEGIFIAPRMDREMEQLLLELPMARILLNFPPPESQVDSVIWDVDEAVHQSVRHLVRAGHRNIMYAGDIVKQRGFRLRWQAFQEAMREQGLPADPARHATAPFHGCEVEWAKDFLDQFQALHPTAIICGVDEQVAPAYYALTEAGVDIPRACSMVGILNEQTDRLPFMSRPYLPIKEVGYRAADRMLWRLANPTSPFEHIRIRGPFSVGSTTRTM
ncbi:LacI family DNA-binding transcriptional regulator [Cohnella sp. REN36]|uniref:LacI family DNA-binding transcriptional regulator n=1 Tax=Cohnella sp. REN36 TaxID=2887347 RepID=UPI001D137DF2|nr:LacI family DNA-binding transcriptional regulator [Cohnella sp. REN36]MCC3371968.1 LacI family transcriptional regulator [Cohnella sp. REN36]